MIRRVVIVAALAALLASAAVCQARPVSGSVIFDGSESRPQSVDLEFFGDVYATRSLTITGRQTPYTFDLPGRAYLFADGHFASPVAPDAFWLREAGLAVAHPRPDLVVLLPSSHVVDPVIFKRGVRFALPITDLVGRPFRPPRGWRSAGGVFLLDREINRLARGASTLEGIAAPGVRQFDVRLEYRDSFGEAHYVGPASNVELPESAIGTTLTQPALTIDGSPPIVRALAPRGRGYAIFVARERQSSVSLGASVAYVRAGGRWRRLPDTAVAVIYSDIDPDSSYVPYGQTGIRVLPFRAGRHRVRLCAGNSFGVQPAFDRCATVTVGARR